MVGMLLLNEICNAFSVIIDLAGERNNEHSKRTAYIATRLSRLMGASEEMCFFGGLLHDLGASGELSIYGLKEIHTQGKLMYDHAAIGAKILSYFPCLKGLSEIVKYHHEYYDGSGAFKLKAELIPLESRILNFADHLDLFINGQVPTTNLRFKIFDWVLNRSGKKIFPEIKDAFFEIAKTEEFWLDLEVRNLDYSLKKVEPGPIYISFNDFEAIAKAFSTVIDNKSRFTHEHSLNLQKISSKVAINLGYDEQKVRKISIAAYLHDLGKVMVPSSILEKPAKLTPEEFAIIRQHSYYTKKILRQINGLEEIAEWAGNHHERLNGKGYPEGLTDLSEEEQIIAISDVYVALVENRPYRKGMSHQEAMAILKNMVQRGELDYKLLKKFNSIITEKIA